MTDDENVIIGDEHSIIGAFWDDGYSYTKEQQAQSIYKDTSEMEANVGKAVMDYIKDTGAHVYAPLKGGERLFHVDVQVNCIQGTYVAHFESNEPITIDWDKATEALSTFGNLHSWKGCPGRGQNYREMFDQQFEAEMVLKEMGCTEITSVASGYVLMC